MSAEERSAYTNGIWMCGTHGDLIDKDEKRFTKELLHQWRRAAERKAEIRHASANIDFAEFDLFEHVVSTSNIELNESLVGHAFIDAGAPVFWGENNAAAVRDFIFEMASNACVHGGANEVTITFTPKSVRLDDDGAPFDPLNLLLEPAGRGGAYAIKVLKKRFGDRIALAVQRVGNASNSLQVQFLRTIADVTSGTPCAVHYDRDIEFSGALNPRAAERVHDCQVVYIVVPDFMSLSRAFDFQHSLKGSIGTRQVVFVGQNISDAVKEVLGEIPDSRFLELSALGNSD